jgi:hypothetical protein
MVCIKLISIDNLVHSASAAVRNYRAKSGLSLCQKLVFHLWRKAIGAEWCRFSRGGKARLQVNSNHERQISKEANHECSTSSQADNHDPH